MSILFASSQPDKDTPHESLKPDTSEEAHDSDQATSSQDRARSLSPDSANLGMELCNGQIVSGSITSREPVPTGWLPRLPQPAWHSPAQYSQFQG
jgi:hypothetical protein